MLLDLVEKLFGTRDVYSVLNNITARDAADPKKLRSGYLRAALSYHPDKTSSKDKEESTQKFQVLAKIYEVLKDDDNRKAFDESGVWPEDDSSNFDVNIFSRLDESKILDFKKYYQGSEEEMKDVKGFYEKYDGNVLKIMDNLFFADILSDDDLERVEGIIAQLVANGDLVQVPRPKNFEAQKKRKIVKAQKEAAEAAEMLKKMQAKMGVLDSEADLHAAILARRENAGKSFLDNLEAKYSAMAEGKKPSRKKPRKN